jgi:hypothetical protein
MATGRDRTAWVSERRCPACGSPLLTNGERDWCSLVGGAGPEAKACDYGIGAPAYAPGRGPAAGREG